MKNKSEKKLTLRQKVMVFIYILAIIIPFGVCALVFLYLIRYYIFGIRFDEEKELIKIAYRELSKFIKELLQ